MKSYGIDTNSFDLVLDSCYMVIVKRKYFIVLEVFLCKINIDSALYMKKKKVIKLILKR